MAGAIHQIRNLTVQWMFDDKIKICYPDIRPLWTDSFKIVREELEKYDT